jgi:hypothetical protein
MRANRWNPIGSDDKVETCSRCARNIQRRPVKGEMRRLPLMSKLIVVAGLVWAATLPVAAAFAEDVAVPAPPSPAFPTAADALAPSVVPSPPGPQNVPPVPLVETPRTPKSFNIDVKIDGNGIRLGGQLSGDKGVSAAWLGAQVQGNSYGVIGGFQGDGHPPRDFKLNLELLPGWVQTATRVWLMLR